MRPEREWSDHSVNPDHIFPLKRSYHGPSLYAFNHSYFGNGIGLDPSNAGTFGLVTTQHNNPRDIQLGVMFVC